MNVHHLELFYYVAKYEGITAAVRKMPFGIQQPAVSGQLLQLEDYLGLKLFNRRPFSLTSAGDLLYNHIYPFFSELSQVESVIKGEEAKHLTVSASSIVLSNHLPEILAQLQNKTSGLKLSLKELSPSEIHPAIISQQCDIAITILNDQITDGVKQEELINLDMVLLIPSEWDVEEFDHLLEPHEYENGYFCDKPLITLPANELITRILVKHLSKLNISWDISMEVSSLDLIQKYVAQGFGAGLGINSPGIELIKGVKCIPLTQFPTLKIGAIYQKGLKPIAQHFLEDVRAKSIELKTLAN